MALLNATQPFVRLDNPPTQKELHGSLKVCMCIVLKVSKFEIRMEVANAFYGHCSRNSICSRLTTLAENFTRKSGS